MKEPLSKEDEIDAAWQHQEAIGVVPPPVRPFRAEMPEWERKSLKLDVNARYESLEYRVACALELGWLVVEQSPTCFMVTTHNLKVFLVHDAPPRVKGR